MLTHALPSSLMPIVPTKCPNFQLIPECILREFVRQISVIIINAGNIADGIVVDTPEHLLAAHREAHFHHLVL